MLHEDSMKCVLARDGLQGENTHSLSLSISIFPMIDLKNVLLKII